MTEDEEKEEEGGGGANMSLQTHTLSLREFSPERAQLYVPNHNSYFRLVAVLMLLLLLLLLPSVRCEREKKKSQVTNGRNLFCIQREAFSGSEAIINSSSLPPSSL